MQLTEIILLGVGLAMDCFAVSLSKGIASGKFHKAGALAMALSFGIFQAAMPLISYFAGIRFTDLIGRISPWIALILLSFIGGKMVKDHFAERSHPEEAVREKEVDYRLRTILILSVATSIDALATGLLFIGQGRTVWLAVSVIGAFSFLFSIVGTLAGVFAGKRFHFPAELVGGLILIGIGLKIWIEGIFL
ncbi:MAG: manganese efflux pump [Bacteroidales bacterium]|nr:manganese efflux pump [Candidatus Cacconaster merdequi]